MMNAADQSSHNNASSLTEAEQEAALDAQLAERIAAYLHEAPTSEFHSQPIRVVRHWEGQDNLLWQVQAGGNDAASADHAVVKLFLDAGQARGRRQFDGQNTFAPRGIAPQPLWFDRYPQGLARQVLVYRWLEGTEVDLSSGAVEATGSNKIDAEHVTILEGLAQTIATVHNAPVDEVRRFCPHPVNLDFFWRIESDALQNAGERWKATASLHDMLCELSQAATQTAQRNMTLWESAMPTPVHGDLQPENCLIQSNGTAILLDWEMYGLGDPALDVARFLFHIQKQIPTEQQVYFLQPYLSQIHQPHMQERIETYRRLLSVQALTYLLNGVHHALQVEDSGGVNQEAHAQLAENLPFINASVHATLTQSLADFDIVPAQEDTLERALESWEQHVAELVGNE